MFFNPKPYERMLKRFLALQAVSIDSAINNIIPTITRLVGRVNAPIAGSDFRFRDYPALSRAVDIELRSLSRQITSTITAGVEWAWDLANVKNDDMLSRIIRSIGAAFVPAAALARWNQKNLPALEAFEHRRIGGMGLSDKVWAFTKGIKGDLELALDLGLGEGKSADSLSRLIRAYLKEPNRLYRRVRDEKGVLHLSKAASNYHPGQGVYRSSYKNARRLAATETNMAYRSSDFARVQQIDFILGIEVHLSNNHTCLNAKGIPEPFYDICDELAGRYPKEFKFVGWHPLCRCYTTTILPDKDEFFEYLRQMDENGHSAYVFDGQVKEIPPQMRKWLAENEGRIANAKSLPYWIRDNQELLNGRSVETSAENEIPKVRKRTEAKEKDIRSRWNERSYTYQYADNVSRIAKVYADREGGDIASVINAAIKDIGKTTDYEEIRWKTRNLSWYIKDLKDPFINYEFLDSTSKDIPHPALLAAYSVPGNIAASMKGINAMLTKPWFSHGVGPMAFETSKYANGSTIRATGKIFLESERMVNVMNALEKIRAGKTMTMTYSEADAMATYWHEITHNRALSLANAGGKETLARKYMELANEFVARKSLPEFYRALGSAKMPFPELMVERASTGYNRWVKNYQTIVDFAHLDDKAVYKSVREGLFTGDYSKQKATLVDALYKGGIKTLDGKKPPRSMINALVNECLYRYDAESMRNYIRNSGLWFIH